MENVFVNSFVYVLLQLIEWRITEVTISYQYFRIKVLQPKDKFNAEVENKFNRTQLRQDWSFDFGKI